MASSTKTFEPRTRIVGGFQSLSGRWKQIALKRSVLLLLIFSILIFLTALYYVEQQVRLQKLNYEIVELKKQKSLLAEQQKTYQLQLDQLKSLERIEREVKARGFVPIEKEQLRIVR